VDQGGILGAGGLAPTFWHDDWQDDVPASPMRPAMRVFSVNSGRDAPRFRPFGALIDEAAHFDKR
jgi:hypothetical protein